MEIGLVCDDGTSGAGLYGLTDLFTYAGDIAAARLSAEAKPPVRLTQSHDPLGIHRSIRQAVSRHPHRNGQHGD
jgi:hypothetical protein